MIEEPAAAGRAVSANESTAADIARTVAAIYRTRQVFTPDGDVRQLHSEVSEVEGRFVREVILANPSITKTCEVGCAYGLASLQICSALVGRSGAQHLIVDPLQHSVWEDVGRHMLQTSGVEFFELLEEGSELALPRLVEQGREFDLIFIDGLHTFDHTLLDLFYANRLIRPGGIIIVDDYRMESVFRAVRYVAAYPCYEVYGICEAESISLSRKLGNAFAGLVPLSLAQLVLPRKLCMKVYTKGTMIALRKRCEDQRHWAWFRPV